MAGDIVACSPVRRSRDESQVRWNHLLAPVGA